MVILITSMISLVTCDAIHDIQMRFTVAICVWVQSLPPKAAASIIHKQQLIKSRTSAHQWKAEYLQSQILNGISVSIAIIWYRKRLHKCQFYRSGAGLYSGISRKSCSRYKQSVKKGVRRLMKAGQPAFITVEAAVKFNFFQCQTTVFNKICWVNRFIWNL